MVARELTLKRVLEAMEGHDEKRRRLDERLSYDSYRPSLRRESSRDASSSPRDRERKSTRESPQDHRPHSRQKETSANLKQPTTDPKLKDRLTKAPTASSPLKRSSSYSPPSPSKTEHLKSPVGSGVQPKPGPAFALDNSQVHSAVLPSIHSPLIAGIGTEWSEYLGSHARKRAHDCEDSESTTKSLRTESDSDSDRQLTNGSRKLCKNYNCLGEHSYQDCPLPKKCWGCRSTTHYWSYCPMTCTKCQAARHSAKYCDDFEINSTGKSQPKAPPPGTTGDTNGGDTVVQGNLSHTAPGPETNIQQRSSSLLPLLKAEPKSSSIMGTGVLSNGPADKTIQNTSSQEQAANFLAELDELSDIPKGPAASSGHETHPPYPPNTGMYDDKGEKIYCTQWLRFGSCAFYHTLNKCKFKHEIPPDEQTQRDIRLSLASPWLQGAPFAGHSRRNGRVSASWPSKLFEQESPSYQEPASYSAGHDLYRPRERRLLSHEPDTAHEDKYSEGYHDSRLLSAPTRHSSTRSIQPLGVSYAQLKSPESQSPIKEEIPRRARTAIEDLEYSANRAESIARESNLQVLQLANNNAAASKREEAKKQARSDAAAAQKARSLADKEATKASSTSEKAIRTSMRGSDKPTVTQEARRGSGTLPNTAYPTPTSQTHEELCPKGTTKSKSSPSLPGLPASDSTSGNITKNTSDDPMAAMLKAFEEEQAEEEKKHQAAMAAKATKQRQELESHLKRRAYNAKRKREEEERRMDEEYMANIKKLRAD
jgi:hypothetical protein